MRKRGRDMRILKNNQTNLTIFSPIRGIGNKNQSVREDDGKKEEEEKEEAEDGENEDDGKIERRERKVRLCWSLLKEESSC